MLRLAAQVSSEEAARWRTAAIRLLDSLTARYVETHPDAQGLLRGGTYHSHKNLGVNQCLIFGDYYFLEALLMIEGACPDYWGPA
jgi:unsaturated chondroitin disaccharide hydrolase